MRKYCILSIFIFINILIQGQQDPSFSHSMFNLMAVNPAYAGSSDQVCWSIVNRKDWFGFDYSPGVIAANINSPFNLFNRTHGVGLSIIQDQLVDNRNIRKLNLAYAYKFDAGPGKMNLGFSVGFYNITFSNIASLLITPDGGSIEDDPLIPSPNNNNNFNRFAFNTGIGLFYKSDNLYAGLSSTNLLKPKYENSDSSSRVARGLYITSGYDIALSNPLIVFKPSILASMSGPFTKLEATGLLEYNKKIWGGISYRSGAAISALFGISLFNGLDIGLAYDLCTNPLGAKYGTGSYEIIVKGCFNLKVEKKTQQYKSVRFL